MDQIEYGNSLADFRLFGFVCIAEYHTKVSMKNKSIQPIFSKNTSGIIVRNSEL